MINFNYQSFINDDYLYCDKSLINPNDYNVLIFNPTNTTISPKNKQKYKEYIWICNLNMVMKFINDYHIMPTIESPLNNVRNLALFIYDSNNDYINDKLPSKECSYLYAYFIFTMNIN